MINIRILLVYLCIYIIGFDTILIVSICIICKYITYIIIHTNIVIFIFK